jgi:tetratricopeptide (TPR) repeat protein
VDDEWFENLDDLCPDTPAELIDEGIARLTSSPGDADEEMLLLRASLFLIRYVQATLNPGRASAPDDLDQAVHACEEALTRMRRDREADPEFEMSVLQVVAEARQLRDAPGDLDRAIDVMAEATRRFPAGSAAWAMAISGLGDRYFARYTKDHRAADFAATEQALRTAFDAGWPDRPSLWLRLGSLYEERFRAEGDLRHHRRALEILRTGWAEGSGYPLLALSYADAVVNSGAAPAAAELDTAVEELATIDAAALPAMMEPEFHHLVMATHFRRFNERHDPADLQATVAAGDRLIAHSGSEPDLLAEARWIRATARLDHASITGNRMADVEPIIADLSAAVPLLKPDQRRFADIQLIRMLAERARRTGDDRAAAAAEAYATRVLERLPDSTAEHAETLYHLALLLMSRAEAGRADAATTDRAIGLLSQVVDGRATAPKVRAVAAAQLATATVGRVYYWGGDASAIDTAITLARDALRATSLDDLNRVALAAAVAGALLVRFEVRGDLADLRWCLDLLQDTRDEAPDDPNRHELILALAQAQIMWDEAVGDAPPADTLAVLNEVLVSAPPGDPRRIQALRGLAAGNAMRAERTTDPDHWRHAARYARETLAELPSGAPFTALMRMSVGGTLSLAGRVLDDLGLIREGVDLVGAALREPASRLLRGRYLAGYGMALLELHRRAPRQGDLDRAIRALREANDLAAGGPGSVAPPRSGSPSPRPLPSPVTRSPPLRPAGRRCGRGPGRCCCNQAPTMRWPQPGAARPMRSRWPGPR